MWSGRYIPWPTAYLPYHIGVLTNDLRRPILQTPGDRRKKYNIDVRINSEAVSGTGN